MSIADQTFNVRVYIKRKHGSGEDQYTLTPLDAISDNIVSLNLGRLVSRWEFENGGSKDPIIAINFRVCVKEGLAGVLAAAQKLISFRQTYTDIVVEVDSYINGKHQCTFNYESALQASVELGQLSHIESQPGHVLDFYIQFEKFESNASNN